MAYFRRHKYYAGEFISQRIEGKGEAPKAIISVANVVLYKLPGGNVGVGSFRVHYRKLKRSISLFAKYRNRRGTLNFVTENIKSASNIKSCVTGHVKGEQPLLLIA